MHLPREALARQALHVPNEFDALERRVSRELVPQLEPVPAVGDAVCAAADDAARANRGTAPPCVGSMVSLRPL